VYGFRFQSLGSEAMGLGYTVDAPVFRVKGQKPKVNNHKLRFES
jgi:hypothetical protein